MHVKMQPKMTLGQKQVTKTTQTHPAFIKKTFNTLSHDLLHLNKITNHLTKNLKASEVTHSSHKHLYSSSH